ncbi:hypothetical protein [Parasediminibacterium sp. JCM 36343]|uniref:hypothetical protein n=1 Tax=Parasediminibacterium sp. JCM 36343 TaxID=3374279 RepID=UPI0039782EFD
MSSYRLRKVPSNWEHPKNDKGSHIPLLDGSYAEYSKGFDERKEMWNKGFQEDWDIVGTKQIPRYVPKASENEGIAFEEWDGEKRLPEAYRPDWPLGEQTHFQMYEDVTEGTPISPVFEKVEDLASWLCQELGDGRYPYPASKWLEILTSQHPSVEMIMVSPNQTPSG